MKVEKKKPTASSKEESTETNRFPIVGIGASAGGLEAFEQFLSKVPQNSGMAYVVIQHLDPTQKGMLPELLQRITKMKVFQVKNRMVVKPNCVYVIPPNKSMTIRKGVLYLSEPIEKRGLRLPIDYFLSSLANDRLDRSVAVILSGMGADGSIGIRAIKEKNGLTMVQKPETAKFDSMPRNAIDSTPIDFVAPAMELPEKLKTFFKDLPFLQSETEIEVELQDHRPLEKINNLLRARTGNDFTLYKKHTVYRRIERRMIVHKIEKITSYVTFLQENPKEVDILFKELMIGVTNFFRDVLVWDKLKETIVPEMIEKAQAGDVLRAWVPGCSTGEEAYSLAIVFKEVLENINPHGGLSLQIFATDLDNDAIETARKGHFPEKSVTDVSPERLNRFFNKTEEGYRINTEIREMIVFAQHNIIMHPPFSKIDILSCRNLLIYMDAELQKKLFGLFYYSINPEGIMLLGSSESLGTQSMLFSPVDAKLKIFKRSDSLQKQDLLNFPSSFSKTETSNTENQLPVKSSQSLEILANQLLLQHFSPPGVLVNENGDIIYISGRTGKYLEPAVGKANLNIFAMLREGLRNEFPIAFHKAILTKDMVVVRNIKVGENEGNKLLNITIQWIDKPEPLHGMIMIIFSDVPDIVGQKSLKKKGKNLLDSTIQSEMEKELQHLHNEMQSTLEEMQSSQEELKSANEELQSTNEELQSTNEELTSSKEEMQSLNEELQTVNVELQSKVDDFSRIKNDMKNLLNSTDIATLFLDKELNIRRYTNQATKIFKLIKSDVGRPFTDQVSELIYPELAIDAKEVLKTLTFIKKQIPTNDGRWFSIRIMPYRTYDDRIDGLVITFFNISDIKQLEAELHETEQMHRLILKSSTDIILRLSPDWKILEFNTEAELFFRKKQKEVINSNFIELFVPESVQKNTEKEMNKLLKKGLNTNYTMQLKTTEALMLDVEWSVNILLNNQRKPSGMILITKKTNQK